MVTTNTSKRSAITSNKAELNGPQRPETFRLPKSGYDPYFGFGRSYYYEGEQRGYWKLIRIRERGKLRGITLVPYDAVSAFVRKQAEGDSA